MRRRLGRGRGGPSLLGTAARTAVVAGTATAVSGRVADSRQARVPRDQPTSVAPAPGPAQTVDALHEQLTKLGGLRDAGLLTQEEFEQQKARLLG
jgi:hypothetical protein